MAALIFATGSGAAAAQVLQVFPEIGTITAAVISAALGVSSKGT